LSKDKIFSIKKLHYLDYKRDKLRQGEFCHLFTKFNTYYFKQQLASEKHDFFIHGAPEITHQEIGKDAKLKMK
jgi:hypothetical protein